MKKLKAEMIKTMMTNDGEVDESLRGPSWVVKRKCMEGLGRLGGNLVARYICVSCKA